MVNTSKVFLAIVSSASLIGGALANFGDATWFNPGLGSCGQQNGDFDFIAALNTADFAGRGSCGRNVRVNFQGRSVNVQVVDLCPGCGPGGIDLSPAAFQQLASLDVGRMQVEWDFI